MMRREGFRSSMLRRSGMGSVVAVATLGLCTVALGSVTVLLRMDLHRTHAVTHEAQALELLRAGADAAGHWLVERAPNVDDAAVVLPQALRERGDVSVVLRFEELGGADRAAEAAAVRIEVRVGDTIAEQRLTLTRPAGDSDWVFESAVLERVFSSP